MTPTAKTVLYVRVSTAEQTSAQQLAQAREAGFHIESEHVITDHGVSGVSTLLKERDQGRRLFDLLQPGDKLLVRWVDRLGRNYEDVKEVIETFNKHGVTVCTVINRMTFEADYKLTDPTMKASRAAILAFMSALAEADATAIRKPGKRASTMRRHRLTPTESTEAKSHHMTALHLKQHKQCWLRMPAQSARSHEK